MQVGFQLGIFSGITTLQQRIYTSSTEKWVVSKAWAPHSVSITAFSLITSCLQEGLCMFYFLHEDTCFGTLWDET